MKVVFTLTFVIAIILTTLIGCLVILEIISLAQGKAYLWKSLALAVLLGGASALLAYLSGRANRTKS